MSLKQVGTSAKEGCAAPPPAVVLKKGFACLQHVANMMLRMKREFAGSQNQILPVFDSLLLLDRNVDLLTPLATQLTYEGLIDEIYGITNGPEEPSPSLLRPFPSAEPLTLLLPTRRLCQVAS